jgi:hypothetical protein
MRSVHCGKGMDESSDIGGADCPIAYELVEKETNETWLQERKIASRDEGPRTFQPEGCIQPDCYSPQWPLPFFRIPLNHY